MAVTNSSGESSPNNGARPHMWAAGAWIVAVFYYADTFYHRWIPFDEGTIGQSARRVLQGEVPHRDFDAMYTGLMEYMHAGAMSVLGVELLTPRLVMLLAVMLWVPAVWSLARQMVGSPAAAAGLTVLAMIVGPPNYPAAMPSWYNLFFATWGLWALVRWAHSGRSRWLVAAGAAAGLSILFKVAGLYFLAGALFFVLHKETLKPTTTAPGAARPGSRRIFAVAASTAVVLLVLLETRLVWPQIGAATLVNYVLPTALAGGLLVWHAWSASAPSESLQGVVVGWSKVLLGVLLPVLPFLAWYAAVGGLDDLYRGVFLLPQERMTGVAIPVPSLARTWGSIGIAGLLLAAARVSKSLQVVLAVAVLAAGLALQSMMSPAIFVGLLSSLLLIVPVVSAGGVAAFARGTEATQPARLALLATLWTLALVHLVRYPFAGPIYFTYVAPLGVLAAGGVLAAWRTGCSGEPRSWIPGAPVAAAVAVVCAGFFVLGPNRGGLFGPLPAALEAPLDRQGLLVPASEALEYLELVETLTEVATGPFVYAAPDAAEVSFLSGLQNPTRSLFEVFEEQESRTERTMAILEDRDVNVVVLNSRPRFSTLPPDLIAALIDAYPMQRQIGRFVVRWR